MDINESLVFEGEMLRVNDPGHVSLLDRERWSASSNKSFHSCPARWASSYLIPEEFDPFGPAPLGTAVHKVYELLYSLPPEERTRDAAAEFMHSLPVDYADEVEVPDGAANLSKWFAKLDGMISPLWLVEDPMTVDVFACEQEVLAEIGGVPFKGYLDRTDNVPGGKRVADYKTGRAKTERDREMYGDDHGDQLRLYVRALENRDGEVPVSAGILYTSFGKTYEADISRPLVDRVEHEFVQTYHQMKASAERGSYGTNPGPLCGWCPFATVCPSAQRAGKDAARTERAKVGALLGIRACAAPVPSASMSVSDAKVPAIVNRKGKKMGQWSNNEDAAYKPTLLNGEINPNGYASIAVNGLTSWAVELMAKNGITEMKGSQIEALARTLAYILNEATTKASKDGVPASWESGLGTRIRGHMHTVIDHMEPPSFEWSPEEWKAWAGRTAARAAKLADVAYNMYINGPGTEPWTNIVKIEKEQ